MEAATSQRNPTDDGIGEFTQRKMAEIGAGLEEKLGKMQSVECEDEGLEKIERKMLASGRKVGKD